nr:acyl-CoA dehydratase activase-related protein [Desulforamulus aquiferis]
MERIPAAIGCRGCCFRPNYQRILTKGVQHCVDEACLPVKLAFGHVGNLANKNVDYIFLPRMVSVAQGEYICPKFLGFPDMIKQNIKGLPPVIDSVINLRNKPQDINNFTKEVGSHFNKGKLKAWLAYRRAMAVHKQYTSCLNKANAR